MKNAPHGKRGAQAVEPNDVRRIPQLATASNMSDSPEQPRGHFARLNALVDGGWLASLSHTEAMVWLVYERHAANDGTAYPSPTRIARMIGHTDASHVRRARSRLVQLQLLQRIDSKGGNAPGKFRVVIPPPMPNPTLRQIGASADSAHHPTPNRRRDLAPNRRNHPTPNRRTEGHIEQTNEHPTTTTQAGSGGGGVIAEFFSENQNAARKYSALANERWTPDEQRALVDYLTDGREITHPKRFLKGLLDDPTSVIDWEPIEQWEASIVRAEKVREAEQATNREDQEREAARVAVKKINPAELRAWLVVLARVDERFGKLWIDRYPGDCVLDNATHYRNQRHLISIQRNSPRAIIAAIAAATPDQRAEVEALARKFDAECRPARAEVTA